jgi:hypothetical protein
VTARDPSEPIPADVQAADPARPITTAYRPADVIRDLVTLLRGHGLTHLYWSACALLAVVSVPGPLTVWCDGHRLTCRYQGTQTSWPAASTEQAAKDLAAIVRTSIS